MESYKHGIRSMLMSRYENDSTLDPDELIDRLFSSNNILCHNRTDEMTVLLLRELSQESEIIQLLTMHLFKVNKIDLLFNLWCMQYARSIIDNIRNAYQQN